MISLFSVGCIFDLCATTDSARDSGGIVLVHCFAGVSRTAAITIAYFVQTFDMTVEAAYAAIRAKRPAISPNLNFMGQLQRFEEDLRASRAVATLDVDVGAALA